jgi:Ca2+-binding RTX toxin-like protein
MRNAFDSRTFGAFEQLESRRLLSASLESGVLVITGTQHSDEITLRLNHADTSMLDVSFNGDTTQFAVSDITGGVSIDGKQNKDHVLVSETEGALSLNVSVVGGSGRDVIRTASGDDSISGGNGKDLVYAGDGKDSVDGGNGNDEINGEDGDDVLRGARGSDVLRGGEGDDDLDGGKGGNDNNFGGNGNDDFASAEKSRELKDSTSDDDGDNANDSDIA